MYYENVWDLLFSVFNALEIFIALSAEISIFLRTTEHMFKRMVSIEKPGALLCACIFR